MTLSHFLLLIPLMLLIGCSGAEHNILKQADLVMEEYPDSAFSLLQTIDRSHIADKDLPYYALLLTQAQVKNEIPVASDSLISIAYREYADDWWGDKGIRSCFYLGETFYNQKKPRDAMKFYLMAYEQSKRHSNLYWRAKSAERIADLFFFAYNYPEALKYRNETIEYYGKANRPTNQRYAIADLAIIYDNMKEYDTSALLFDSLLNICYSDIPTNNHLIDYIRRLRIYPYVRTGRFNELDSVDLALLNKVQPNTPNLDNTILKGQIPELNDAAHDYDHELDSLGKTASTEDKGRLLYTRYLNAKQAGDFSRALSFSDSLIYLMGAVSEEIIQESAAGAQRDFYSSLAYRKDRESRFLLLIFFCSLFIFGIIIFAIWKINRLREINRKAELEANIESFIALKTYSDKLALERQVISMALQKKNETVEQLQNELNNIHQDVAELDELRLSEIKRNDIVLSSLFREKWTTLNLLCDAYYEKGESVMMRERILSDIEKELKKISTKKGLSQIEEAADKYMNGIVSHLRNECAFLNEKDIIFAMLIMSGFSAKAVCYITGIKTGNFYVKKSRLVSRISESDAPHKQQILEFLS